MKTIVVWFSCGAASAVAAKKTLEYFSSTHIVKVVNNPVANEHPDNKRFLKDVEKWLGVEIELAVNKKYPEANIVEVFDQNKYMSGTKGARCTLELKKRARQQWEEVNDFDYMVFGFTVDEVKRHNQLGESEFIPIIPILIYDNLTKQDCFDILKAAKIDLPAIYSLGFPNANCMGCVKATSPTYWNKVREDFPEVFQERLEQSERLGCRLVRVKGERKFLSELLPDQMGRPLTKYDLPDCGILCELP